MFLRGDEGRKTLLRIVLGRHEGWLEDLQGREETGDDYYGFPNGGGWSALPQLLRESQDKPWILLQEFPELGFQLSKVTGSLPGQTWYGYVCTIERIFTYSSDPATPGDYPL